MVNWENIHCPICGEKRKNTRNNKVWYDPKLSDKKKGKIVFFCTNHPQSIHFVVEVFEVHDAIATVRVYVIYDRKPQNKN